MYKLEPTKQFAKNLRKLSSDDQRLAAKKLKLLNNRCAFAQRLVSMIFRLVALECLIDCDFQDILLLLFQL